MEMWIKIEGKLPYSKKTIRLAKDWGVSRREALGFLVEFFIWVREHAETGYIGGWQECEIAESLPNPPKGFIEDLKRLELVSNAGWVNVWPEWGGAEIAERARREPAKYPEMVDYYGLEPYGKKKGNSPENSRLEEKRREEKRRDSYTPEFEKFWESTTKRGNKFPAFRSWQKLTRAEQTLAVTNYPKHKARWEKEGTARKYIPHVSKWINEKAWEADLVSGSEALEKPPCKHEMYTEGQPVPGGTACVCLSCHSTFIKRGDQ